MIKFQIHPKIWEGDRCKYGKLFEKCQNYRFFDIFWDILNKMNNNLGQECIKGGFYPSRAKLKQLSLISLEEMTVFSSFDPTFPPVPP